MLNIVRRKTLVCITLTKTSALVGALVVALVTCSEPEFIYCE